MPQAEVDYLMQIAASAEIEDQNNQMQIPKNAREGINSYPPLNNASGPQ